MLPKLALVAALLLAVCVPLTAGAASPLAEPTPGPGALTQEDPFVPALGNGGYRVRHYDLDLRYVPHTRRLGGTVTIAATTTHALTAFSLDLVGMRVGAVLVDGAPVPFRRTRTKLVVTPPAALAAGRAFSVAVRYSGVPSVGADRDGGAGWYATDRAAAAYDEPDGARRWFPNDGATTAKAPYDITMTVPAGFTAVGNGRLVSRTTSRTSRTTTWHWRERSPMVAYAATVAIGRFALGSAPTAHGVRISTAVERSLPRADRARARTRFAELPRLLRFFRARLGPYPFATAGGIVGRFGFGSAPLETQTKPLYDGRFSSGTQAHEIAHQWFGDSLTLTRWSDIWLHEGFATFAEWLWERRGPGELAGTFADLWKHWDERAPALARPGANLFSAVTYERGGATLQGLRMLMGDARFFALLREWTGTHRYGNVTTDEFLALARARGGAEAERFLRQWLYGRDRPALPAKIVKRLDALR